MSKLSIALIALALPLAATAAVTVAGNTYPDSIQAEGKALGLLGAGLREKWFFDVYSLAAYSESKSCKPSDIYNKEEVKRLRLDMLRSVEAEKMASTIGGAFDEHMPKDAPASLKEQRKAFESYFKEELGEGQRLEFTYVPGTGTIIEQNGKRLGPPIEGSAFHQVLWHIYFGENTCCGDLKKSVLETCK